MSFAAPLNGKANDMKLVPTRHRAKRRTHVQRFQTRAFISLLVPFSLFFSKKRENEQKRGGEAYNSSASKSLHAERDHAPELLGDG